MAAPTEYYVDPSIAASTGAGTIGDPYGDIQHALDTVTRDATNGDKFNIKAGTDEILSSALTLATYGTPTRTSPVIFRGYTSTADDGGIGGISGNGSVSIFSSTTIDGIWFVDMHLHNTGANIIFEADQYCYFVNCEFDNSTGGGLSLDNNGAVLGCYFHNISGTHACRADGDSIIGCSFEPDGKNPTRMIWLNGIAQVCVNNLITCAGSTDGIEGAQHSVITNNSIYSNGGTGTGINSDGTDSVVLNNVVEGFSGTGGVGIQATAEPQYVGYNACYNNATNYNLTIDFGDADDNAVMSGSPFTNASTGDFSLVNDADTKAVAYPLSFLGMSQTNYLDKGAVQREEPAGGATTIIVRRHNTGLRM